MNTNDTPDTATSPSADSETPAATGFGAVSRKIRSRTTDLLAVAIVVVGGVSVGSQLVRWWATDETDLGPQLAANTNLTWGDGGAAVSLEFGDQPFQLERQTVRGDRETVFARLVEKCALVAQRTQTVGSEILPAEQKLLELLQRQTPVREQRGVWRVYRIERPMTLVIATRAIGRPVHSPEKGNDDSVLTPQSDQRKADQRKADQRNRRVVCWGMAQPSSAGVWVLFTMQPAVWAGEPQPESGQVELPAGARRILSLRDAAGGALIAFEGEAVAADWKSWFNVWFARHRWQSSRRWVESPAGWSATFVPAEKRISGRIDVSFSPVGENRLNGMISVTTPVGVSQAEVLQEGSH